MILDTSAVIAILKGEPEAAAFLRATEKANEVKISAGSYFEASIIVDRGTDPVGSRRFDEFLEQGSVSVEPVTPAQAKIAREAYRDFGKGSGHAAGLNFGDCFAYALAKDKGEPLLFKGTDFAQTDVEIAEIVQD